MKLEEFIATHRKKRLWQVCELVMFLGMLQISLSAVERTFVGSLFYEDCGGEGVYFLGANSPENFAARNSNRVMMLRYTVDSIL